MIPVRSWVEANVYFHNIFCFRILCRIKPDIFFLFNFFNFDCSEIMELKKHFMLLSMLKTVVLHNIFV